MGYPIWPVVATITAVGAIGLCLLAFVVAGRASASPRGRANLNANVGPWSGPDVVVGRAFVRGGSLQKPPRALKRPPSLKKPQRAQTIPSGRHLQGPGKDTQMGENVSGDAPFPLNDMDKWVLSQTDDTFKCHTWDDLRQIIRMLRARILCYQFCPSPG